MTSTAWWYTRLSRSSVRIVAGRPSPATRPAGRGSRPGPPRRRPCPGRGPRRRPPRPRRLGLGCHPHHELLVVQVERCGRFVQEQDARALGEHPGERCACPFAARQRRIFARRQGAAMSVCAMAVATPAHRPRPRASVPAHGERPIRTTSPTVNGNEMSMRWSSTDRRSASSRVPQLGQGPTVHARCSRPVTATSPATAPRRVDLPAPFGPTRASSSPCRIVEVDAGQHVPAAELDGQALDLDGGPAALGWRWQLQVAHLAPSAGQVGRPSGPASGLAPGSDG